MTSADRTENRVLAVAPTRKDGEVTCALLEKAGIQCILCDDLRQFSAEILVGAGAILLTDAVVTAPGFRDVLDTLGKQPTWSDLPVVALVQGGVASPAAAQVLSSMSNVTLLERPAPTRSVVSAVEAALRARRRQYQIREQIQEIRNAQSRLQETQQRFEAMANSIPQLAWMARPDGWIFWYNQRWHEYCGTTDAQMQGWGWKSVHDPRELPRVIEKWEAALASGNPWEDTFPLRRHDGEYRWHLSRARPFRDSNGAIQLWFGTNTDVTEDRERAVERQRLLESEQSARREAERVSRMKDEFLATLSHELRTPLSAIFGWVQLLKTGQSDANTVAEAVDVIDRNVRMQNQLIEDLLDMSRIISGKIRLDVQPVDLVEVIDAALEVVKPAIDAKGLRLEKVVDPSVGPVSGDFGRLQQVMWNLLTNAVKFTSKGGRIHVLAERVDSHAEISVSDTGEGIDARFLPHLFERFSQADASTTRQHGGLGLGLSIVRNLVELHGGSIRAESRGAGHGATFVINLPLRVAKTSDESWSRRRASCESPPDSGQFRKLDGIKVLVVDDEPDAREAVNRFLIASGAESALAASAAEARALLESFAPDIILSDIGMPGQDGYEFIKTARTKGVKTPAIALTAFARSEDRIRALQAGFQTHLPKPVEPGELLATIASLHAGFRSA